MLAQGTKRNMATASTTALTASDAKSAETTASPNWFRRNYASLLLALYLFLLMLPIYWMLNMSLRPNADILSNFSLIPTEFTLANYAKIFGDPSWYSGYINSIIYVSLNTIISLTVALPAAYAFSRYRFLGDKHLFFWLLTNRMAPPAVFLLPFFQLYSTVGLIDTHIAVALAHCLFNVPLAVWILEGFMSSVPREVDEMAYIDGYSLPSLLHHRLHAADQNRHRRHRLLLLHVFLGRASDGPHPHHDRSQTHRRRHDADSVRDRT